MTLYTKDKELIKPYDLLIFSTGGSCSKNKHLLTYNIYFLKQVKEFFGEGYNYTYNSELNRISYVIPEKSLKIKNPKLYDFFFWAFKHGMSYILVECSDKEWHKTEIDLPADEIINQSDWLDRYHEINRRHDGH